MNIGEASITSSEPQSALFWVVGIQLGLARLTRVDTAADTAVRSLLDSAVGRVYVWRRGIMPCVGKA